jgi:uncharacterized membrane protein
LFEQYQKSGHHEPKWIGVKLLAGGAVGLLLSLGLCGIGAVVHSSDRLGAFTLGGFYLFLVSCATMVLAVLVVVIELVIAGIRNGSGRSGKDDEK